MTRIASLLGGLAGSGPMVLARAPGRVNLIGEHTDYNGLPVLPFAIEADVLVAAQARTDGGMVVRNVDPCFPARRFPIADPGRASGGGDWGDYVRAAVQALHDDGLPVPRGGATLRVDGRIPPAAGVSSSSALVVACALALLELEGSGGMDRFRLAELLARGERFVGTLSGGMDQAAILLGRPACALRLDFHPLRARPVPVPPGASLIVAHTLEQAAKSGAARGLYNQRVVECRLATAVLGRRLGTPLAHLGALPDPRRVGNALGELLPEDAVTRAELVTRLGLDAAEVDRLAPASVALADPGRFVLHARVRHVLAEALRVDDAEAALSAGDLGRLGALLDESHASGAADYGTSTAAADALVARARAAGALGARIVGAGFGGTVLVLAERDHVSAVLKGLDRDFYAGRGGPADARFVVSPSMGASVARVDCAEPVC